jgi:hypothetical protein
MALKTVKVSPAAHAALMERARQHNVPAGVALMNMLKDNSVRVPLESVQRERWEAAAAILGVSLAQFILLRVESAWHASTTEPVHDFPVPPVWGDCCKPDAAPDTAGGTP